ncbi:unnamed protein product [Echinostoma caproni]|uniref:Centrosomal protein of 162 kDa n=1 Tax=Echinostoma caproni TaxID=27848 RepID=A0A183A9P5_9TREM|nr:unnamed protein product [Echinostoma caproni]
MTHVNRKKLTELKNECDRLQSDLQTRTKKAAELDEEVKRWKMEATKSPSVMQRQLTDRLRADLVEKEKQKQALSKALADLRREFLVQAEQSVVTSANNPVRSAPVKESSMIRKVAGKPVSTVPSVRAVIAANDEAQRESIRIASTNPTSAKTLQLETENKRLVEECQTLKRQLDRMKQTRRLAEENQLRRQLEDLTCKNRSLEEENKRLRMAPEKPYQETVRALRETAQAARNNNLTSDWESRKRLETEVNRLRNQSVKLNSDMMYLQKQLDLTKGALERMMRENDTLRARVQARWGPGALPDGNSENITNQPKQPIDASERVSLHKQVEDLKIEVERLRRAERISAELSPSTKVVTDQTVAIEALEMRNRIATDRIKALEQQLKTKGFTTENQLRMEHALQEDLLRLNKENLELRFELETLRADVPRMKTRIHDLQTYVEVLKEEKEALRAGRPLDRSQTPDMIQKSSSFRDSVIAGVLQHLHGIIHGQSGCVSVLFQVGESGKSTKELEQIIVRLKRVLQRTQEENERLKCAPGPVSQEETKRMKAEIEKLRAKLERAELAAGACLNSKRLNTEKSMLRLSQEYEQLRKSYEEVVQEKEKTQAELRKVQYDAQSEL